MTLLDKLSLERETAELMAVDFEVSADPGRFPEGAALPLTAIFENRIWIWLAQKTSSLRAGALYGSVPSFIPDAVSVVPVAA